MTAAEEITCTGDQSLRDGASNYPLGATATQGFDDHETHPVPGTSLVLKFGTIREKIEALKVDPVQDTEQTEDITDGSYPSAPESHDKEPLPRAARVSALTLLPSLLGRRSAR